MALLGPGFATYASTVDAAAAAYPNVPAPFLASILQQESGFNPNVRVGSAGDTGIAQFIPSTAAALGVNPNDPTQSIYGAAQLLSQNITRTGSLSGAASMYNSGSATGAPGYASQVLSRASQIAQAAGGGALSSAVSSLTSKAVNLLKTGAYTAVGAIPVAGPALQAAASAFGLAPGQCGVICQLQNWIASSKFFNRVGLVIVGFIFLFAAFYLLGRQTPVFTAAKKAFS